MDTKQSFNPKSKPGTVADIAAMAAQATAPAKAAATLPAQAAPAVWGATEDMDSTDLLIPKIYHQQAMSKLVADGQAKPGDFCDSLTGQVLAKKEEALEVIIFGAFKTMVISKHDTMSNRWKLDEVVRIDRSNAHNYANVPFMEETTDGKFKNNLYYNYYCLIPGRATELPYIMSLGSTKTKVARKLNTMLAKLQQLGKPSAAVVFEMRSVPEKNDRGQWFGLEVAQGRAATKEEMDAAHAWYLKSRTQSLVAAEGAEDAGSDDDMPF